MATSERHAPGVFGDSERRLRQSGAVRAPSPERLLLPVAPQSWLCSICRDCVQHEPVLTACGHSFCKSCLSKVLRPSGPPVRARCPICRTDVSGADAVQPNAALRAELAKHALACTNPGCAAAAVCARDWRSHQEACPFTEVQCKHNAHGCAWRGARKEMHTHLEGCPFHALRSYLNKTNQQIHHLRHLAMHFETALGQAGAQLAALRQWRNGNLAHYAEFLWHIYAEPKAYDANLSRWRSSLDVVFLETLLVAAPLLAVHHALLGGAVSAAPICRLAGAELSPLLGSDALERRCMQHAFRAAPGIGVWLALHAFAAGLFAAAMALDGWASPRGWRLWWTRGTVMAYAGALTPAVMGDAPLACALLLVYTLQFGLEAITGHNRFAHAIHRGCVLAACWGARHGALKVALVAAVWACNAALEARVVTARRELGRPLRSWSDVAALLRLVARSVTTADAAAAGAAATAVLAAVAWAPWGEVGALLQWFANMLLYLLGCSFGMRYTAASVLQLALDTRGRNALAAAGCRLLLASALLGGLYIARRCVMLSS